MVLIFSVSLMHSHITWCDCALRRQKKLIPYLAALTLRKFLWVSCCTIPRVFCGSLNLPCWHSRLFLGKWTFLNLPILLKLCILVVALVFSALWLLMRYAQRVVIKHLMVVGWNQCGLVVPLLRHIIHPITSLQPLSGFICDVLLTCDCLNLLLNAHIFC